MTEAIVVAASGRAAQPRIRPSQPRTQRGEVKRQARARVVVVAALVAFCAVQFGLSRAVETDALPIRDPIFSEKFDLLEQHREFFASIADRPRLIALGSSRTLLAVDAESVGRKLNASAFNFGCHGSGPITTALYLRRLFAAGIHAETVLIELHPAMLVDHDPPFEHRWLHEYRLKRDEPAVLHGYGWSMGVPLQHRPAGWLATAHTYRFAALDRYASTLSPCPFGLALASRVDQFGFVRGVEVSGPERAAALLRECSLYLPAFADFRPGGAAVAAVRDAIAQCRAHGARPLLLLTAESSEFRSWYGPAGNVRLSEWLTAFTRECSVRLIDAREWVPDAHFADGHHLTPAGAEAFTTRLAEELRR